MVGSCGATKNVGSSQSHRLCVTSGEKNLKKTTLQSAFGDFGHIVQIETPKAGIAFVAFFVAALFFITFIVFVAFIACCRRCSAADAAVDAAAHDSSDSWRCSAAGSEVETLDCVRCCSAACAAMDVEAALATFAKRT